MIMGHRVSLLNRMRWLYGLLSLIVMTSPARAQNVAECQEMLLTGKYAECLEATTKAIEERSYGEEWPMLKAQCELATGKYPEALATIQAGIERYNWSVRLNALLYEAALANGQKDIATQANTQIEQLAASAAWRYTDADDLVALGQTALALGADPKAVQEGFFERARRNYPNRPDGFIASARLALAKGDAAFAADLMKPALEEFANVPEVHFLYAESIASADREQAAVAYQKALELNPSYTPGLLKLIERHIDAEAYAEADTVLQSIFSFNPNLPDAYALKAVLCHLQNDAAGETAAREQALKFAPTNPRPDHLIGVRLSRKYRFREGAAYQRRALEMDPNFNDAKAQLAQDLLRLGEEKEAWQLAEQAHEADGYSTTLFNLLQLKDSLDRFTTITTEHFEIRMSRSEAAVYGQRTAELLEQVWAEQTARYEFTPEFPVYVEIYPRVDDFAVRTFGMPDVAGFLGVCFGRVITANSPASRRDQPTNWESVLWHEFCHVVTLQKTGNRIPRWLSEGISVHEERRHDSRWGQSMSAAFKTRILEGNVTPVRELSSAFLKAQSGEDLNFAYYESSMVVEYLVKTHGVVAVTAVLNDLNAGVSINDALDRHAGGLEALELGFSDYLKAEAGAYGPEANLSTAELQALATLDLAGTSKFVEENPGHAAGLIRLAELQKAAGDPAAAEATLRKVISLVPNDDGTLGARTRLAEILVETRPDDALELWREHLKYTADDLEIALRLQDAAFSGQRWDEVTALGALIFSIDPFQIISLQRTADAAEKSGNFESASKALACLIELQPDDAAKLHLRIAQVARQADPELARRHVLLALEKAPRYRAAHVLLLELQPVPTPAAAQ